VIVITAEKESILHLKNGAKSVLGERDLVGVAGRERDGLGIGAPLPYTSPMNPQSR